MKLSPTFTDEPDSFSEHRHSAAGAVLLFTSAWCYNVNVPSEEFVVSFVPPEIVGIFTDGILKEFASRV